MQIKVQYDTTTELLEWLESKRLTIPGVGEDVEQLELSDVVGGSVEWFDHFGKTVS